MQEAQSEANRLNEMPLSEAQALCRDRARQGGPEREALEKALAGSSVASDRVWYLLLRCYESPEEGFSEVVRSLLDSGAVGLTGWDRGWTSGWLPAIVARRILTAPDLAPPHRRDPDSLDVRSTALWLRVLAECPMLLPEDRAFLRSAMEDPDLDVWPHAARAFGRNALHDAELRTELVEEVIALLRQGRIEFPHAARRRRARACFVAFCAFLSASPLPAEVGGGSPPEPPFELLPPWVRGVIRGHSLDFLPARLSADLDLATVLLGCDCLLEVEAYRPRMRERLAALVDFLKKRPYPVSTEMVGSLLARAVRAGHLDTDGVHLLQTLAVAWGGLAREGAADRFTAFLVFEHLGCCLAEMAHGEARGPAIEALLGLAGSLPDAPDVARTVVWEALWSAGGAEALPEALPPSAQTWLQARATRGLDLTPVGAALSSSETFEFVHSQRWLATRVGAAALQRAGLDPSRGEGAWVSPLWREVVATLLAGLQHAAAWNLLSSAERALYVWRLCHLFEEGVLPEQVQIADVLYLIAQGPSPGTAEYGDVDTRTQLLLEVFVRASELEGTVFASLPRVAHVPRRIPLDAALRVIEGGPSPVLEPYLALDLRRHFRRIASDVDASLRDLYRLTMMRARAELFAALAEALRESSPDAAALAEEVGLAVRAVPDAATAAARLRGRIEGKEGAFLEAWRAIHSIWGGVGALTWEDPQGDLDALEKALTAAAGMVSALRGASAGEAAPDAWSLASLLRLAKERLAAMSPTSTAALAGLEARWKNIGEAVQELRRGVGEALPPLERTLWEGATSAWGARLAERRERAGALEMAWRASGNGARDAESVGRLARAARDLLRPERAERLLGAISEQWMREALASSAPADAAEALLAGAAEILTPSQKHSLAWIALSAAMERGGEADVRAWFSRVENPTHAEGKRVAHWWLDRYAIREARAASPRLAALWPLHHAPTLLGVLVGFFGTLACAPAWEQLAHAKGYVEMAIISIGSLAAAAVCVVWDLQEHGVVPRGLPSSTAVWDGVARMAPLLELVVGEALFLNLAGQLLLSRTPLLAWRDSSWWGAVQLLVMTSAVTTFLGLFAGTVAFRRSVSRSARG